MLATLLAGDGRGGLLGIVHLGRDALPFPCCEDARVEIDNIRSALADFIAIEENIVVVVVQNERYVQFFAYGEKIVDRVANIVVLEDETVLDGV